VSIDNLIYNVPGMTCEHCRTAISKEVGAVPGVEAVNVDLTAKIVTVHGVGISDAAVRDAIDEAGYDVGGEAAL
jgi:copper chaperone CopZ